MIAKIPDLELELINFSWVLAFLFELFANYAYFFLKFDIFSFVVLYFFV